MDVLVASYRKGKPEGLGIGKLSDFGGSVAPISTQELSDIRIPSKSCSIFVCLGRGMIQKIF